MSAAPDDRLARVVASVAVVVLGLSAGAMLTEAAVFVPYWQSLPPQEFLAWFAANEPHLVAFFGPLQTLSAILVIAAAGLYRYRRLSGAGLMGGSAALAVAVLSMFFLYFRDANAGFVAGTVAAADLPAELARWAAWQWVRTAIGTAAFVAALAAAQPPGRYPR